MKGNQIMFFGTKEDLEPVIKNIESGLDIKYFEMGLFDYKKEKAYYTVDEIPEFGNPIAGDWNYDLRLMMVPKNVDLFIRDVPQRKGGVKYAIDPLVNQTSICFQFGGIVKEGILLAGTSGTTYFSDFALNIYKEFSSSLKRNFKKTGNFYVGVNAEIKLKEGWRLVTNEKSTKEHDLSIN